MVRTTKGFDGLAGRMAASAMARLNHDMEEAAVAMLDPSPDADVLTIGFGPGVGVAMLAARLTRGSVAGVDPASTMVALARRRNRAAVESGRVSLVVAGAASIPWPDSCFAGVIAVNNLQLWDPLDASAREVARVLRPGGNLVTLTHCWAIERRRPRDEWAQSVTAILAGAGLGEVSARTQSFRSGDGLVLCARAGTARATDGWSRRF